MVHLVFLSVLLFSTPALNRNKKAPFVIISIGLLFLFLAIRFDYGNDYMSYLQIHEAINAGRTAYGDTDVLFKISTLLIPNFYLYIAVISAFYLYTIFFLISTTLKTKYYWFAMLLLLINPYLFLIHLSGIRQMLAMCFFIFAVNFAVKRKALLYFVFVGIAAGFHSSALFLLPFYFVLNEKGIGKVKMVLIYGSLLAFFATPFFYVVLDKILYYFPQYVHYVETGVQNSLRSTLISSFFFFLIITNINKLKGKEIIFGKLALIATVISLLSVNLAMLTRIGMYFNVFLIIAIPLIFLRLKHTASKQILFIVMLGIYLLRYVSFFNDPLWKNYYAVYKTIIGY